MNSIAKRESLRTAHDSSAILASLRLLLLPVATSVLLALAFPPGNYRLLAWVGLVPLGLALRDKNNWPELYFGLYFAGIIFQLSHLDWIRSGDGSTSLSGPRAVQWLAQGVILAGIWPLVMLPGRAFIHRLHLPMAISLPILWVAFEFGRKHAWTIVDATGYPYGQLGLTQAVYPRLIQLADVGGIYVVTGLVAAVNGLVVDVIGWLMARRKRDRVHPPLAEMAAVSAAVSMAWVYGTWRVSQNPARTGPSACLMPASMATLMEPIEPGVEHDDEWLSEAIATSGLREEHGRPLRPELLIWSEAAGSSFSAEHGERSAAITAFGSAKSGHENAPPVPTGEPTADMSTVDRMERFSRRINAALVIGADQELDQGNPRYCNSAAVVDPQRGYVGCYDKLRLVPFSEFYPPGRPKFAAGVSDRYVPGRGWPVFEMTSGAIVPRYSVAVAIYYDTAFPDVFRRFMRPGTDAQVPDFFVVPACEAHDRQMRLQDTLLQIARFRAIECRRAFVRNSEGGYSGIIDGNGTLIAAPSEIDFDKPVILGRMPMDSRFSPYAVLGDWLPIAAWGAIGIVILAPLGRQTKALLFRRATNPKAAAELRAATP